MADSTISIRITASGDALSPSAPSAPAVNPRRPDAATAGAAERAASAAAASATRETAGVVAGAQKSLAGALASFVAGQGLAMGLSAYTSAVTAVNPERRQSMAYLSAIGGGSIAGGATGAAIGSVVPGIGTVVGGAIGATVGAAAGALSAWTEELKSSRQAINDVRRNAYAANVSRGMERQDEAFARSMRFMTREQRDEAIGSRALDILRGDGDLSIRSLEAFIEKKAKAGVYDSEELTRARQNLSAQYARLGNLQKMDDQNFFLNLPDLYGAKDFSDRIQAMGGRVGPSVDVRDINQQMLSVLRELLSLEKSLANASPSESAGILASKGLYTPHAAQTAVYAP